MVGFLRGSYRNGPQRPGFTLFRLASRLIKEPSLDSAHTHLSNRTRRLFMVMMEVSRNIHSVQENDKTFKSLHGAISELSGDYLRVYV